jgi:hypothetical protein
MRKTHELAGEQAEPGLAGHGTQLESGQRDGDGEAQNVKGLVRGLPEPRAQHPATPAAPL